MDKTQTPTYKMVGGALVKLGLELDKELLANGGSSLPFGRMIEISETICMLLGGDEFKPEVLYQMRKGLDALEKASKDCPGSYEDIAGGACHILIGMLKVAICIAGDRVKVEIGRLSPLAHQNKIKEEAISRAQALAVEMWAADQEQEVRTGEMADMVYRKLIDEGRADQLPGTSERLKEWIKSVAPSYARKGGRRKTPRP